MIDVIKTDKCDEIFVPESISEIINFDEKLKNIQKIFAIEISKKFNIDYSKIMDNIPKTIIRYYEPKQETKQKQLKTKKIYKIEEWKNSEKKEDLKKFKLVDLKKILKDNNIKIKGNKNEIIDKIWNLLHPEIPLKINDNNNNILDLLSNGKKITIDKTEYILINDWLFFENDEIYKYVGFFKNNTILKRNAPNELIKMMYN